MDLIERKKILLIDVLKDFDVFCREHEIEYFISYGTLLGAVRHGGFIPWDDDIDVSMHIEDCLKLQRAWKKYGNKEKYFLQNKKSDPYLPNPFWRLRVNGTTGIEKDHLHIPMHWGIPLDIFPIYNIPKNKKIYALMLKFFYKARGLCGFGYGNYDSPAFTKKMKLFETKCCLTILFLFSKFSSHSGLASDIYGNASEKVREKKDFFPTKDIQFENIILKAPNDPDKYLSLEYGDYMTPPPHNQREGHITALIDLDNDYTVYTGNQK